MKYLKIKYMLLIAAIAIVFPGTGAHAEGSVDERPKFDPSTIIVETKPQSTGISLFSVQSVSNDAYAMFDELGITEIDTIATVPSRKSFGGISLFSTSMSSDGYVLQLTLPEAGEDKVLEAVETLNNSGAVEYAQPNYYYYLDAAAANDTYYARQYNLSRIQTAAVWELGIDCSDIAVAVIDSGLFAEHEDIAPNLWTNPNEAANDRYGYYDDYHGWDFTTRTALSRGDNSPDDPYDASVTDKDRIQGHGTHVAGIVSAKTGNGKGIASVARNAKIVPLRIFDENGGSSTSYIVGALDYVRIMNFPIANCSWGGSLDTSVRRAFQRCPNTLFTVSSGNYSLDLDIDDEEHNLYPVEYGFDNIISVASTDINDVLSSFSDYGATTVDIAAPGSNILSARNINYSTNVYGALSGTSQAAPLVASVAAVIKAKNPSLTPAQIKQCILKGADTVSALEGKVIGARRLNAYEALKYASSPYTVTWKNEDGTVIDITSVAYKTIPSHKDAVKEDTAEYTYTFKGWQPAVTAVTDDTEYTAAFESKKRSYKITWKNDDGTVLDTETLEYGEIPSHADVEKADTAEYYYSFREWYPTPETVTGDAVYTAVFDSEKRSYTVTWKNEDGTVIDTETLEYGETPSHADAEKADTAEYRYSFKEWYPAIKAVTGDVIYTAVFDKAKQAYEVTWRDEDENVIDTETLEYGEIPHHISLEKESDEQYDYTFTGWSPVITAVTGDAEYTAVFTATEIDAKKTYIDVTDKFAPYYKIEKTVAEDGSALLRIIPDIDMASDAEEKPPQFTAYLAIYTEDGGLETVKTIDFAPLSAAIEQETGKNCKLFVWTDKYEPVINGIQDMTDFWNEPSQN